MTKVYIWSSFTRLFHILLVLLVLFAFLLAENESLLSYHAAVGLTIGVLLIYRIIWGFIGVKYSSFRDFNFNLLDLKDYMLNIFGNKKEYIGHNPASSWAIVFIIILALGSVLTGMIVYGAQEGMGIFSFLNISLFRDMEMFEEIHEFFTNSFMAVIFIHIAGVVLDKILHKSSAVESMVGGYKNMDGESLKLTQLQKLFGLFWIGSSILFLIYVLSNPSNILLADSNAAVNYKKEHKLFFNECVSCHTLYPPYLLPKRSWAKLMDNLENHFGDDASLEKADLVSIKEYLIKNAAETSTKESAFKILMSSKSDETIAITKTAYWEKKHAQIEKNIFKSKNVLSKSNCNACHKNVEQGLLNDKEIKISQG